MTETRGAHTDGTGATEDIQQLQDRIRELEQQLASRDAVAAKGSTTAKATPTGGGNTALKILTGALAAVSLVMALPAFVTIRRWVDWWRY